MVIQPIIIEGEFYTPTEYISNLLDTIEQDIKVLAESTGLSS